ncbi:MAG: CoA transferase, partial [Candidatus Bathyarchaeia archaeon]
GIQAAAVRSLRDVVEDKGLRDRGFLIEKDGGTWLRSPLRGLSQVELGPAPKLGEHNRYVFLELLGMEEEEFENYRQKGVI